MLWIIAFVVFSRGVGAAREIAIAYRYGVSELIDVYLLVFTMVAFIPGVLASVFQSVLVPQASKLSIPDRRRLDAELTGLVVLTGSALALLLAAGLPVLIGWVSPGWSQDALRSGGIIAYSFAPLVLAGLLISLFTAQLVRSDVRSPPLFEAIPGAAVLIAVLAAGQPTLWPLIIGTVSGLTIQCIGLGWLAWRNGAMVAPRFRFRSPNWAPFLHGAGVIIVGQLLASIVLPIDQLIAARLGEGVVAQFGYASRLLGFANAVFAIAVARALLPTLSRLGEAHLRRTLTRRWTQLLFLSGAVLALLIWWFATEIVELLFQRGAFVAADTIAVSEILRAAAFQIPVYLASIVLIQLLTSEQKLATITLIAAAATLVKVPASYVLAELYGPAGIMWATAAMYTLVLMLLMLAVRRR
jgi:peptidoglycan biosynthesis protein MviN/MurJ (putative lipid II flippase)